VPTLTPTQPPTMAVPDNQIGAKLSVFAAKSENPDHPQQNAVDGDRESYWQPDYYVDAEPWIIFNLSYAAVVDEVILDVRNSIALGSTGIITIRVCAWEPSGPSNRNPQSKCDFRYLSPRWDLTDPLHTWMVFDMDHFITERIDVTAYGTPFEIYSVWAIEGTAPPIPTHAPVATQAPIPTQAPTNAKAPTKQPIDEEIIVEVEIPETESDTSMSVVLIIAIAVASFFGGLLICCGFCWFRKRKSGRYQFEYGAPQLSGKRKPSMSERLVMCPFFLGNTEKRRYSSQIAPRGLNFDGDDDSDYIRQLRVTQQRQEERVHYPELEDGDFDGGARGQANSSSEGTVPARLIPRKGTHGGRSTLSPVPEASDEFRTLLPDDERIESEHEARGDEVYGTPDGVTGGDAVETTGEEGELETPMEPMDLLEMPAIAAAPSPEPRVALPRSRGEPTEPEDVLRPAYTEDLTPSPARSRGVTNSEMKRGMREPLPPSSESSKSSERSEGRQGAQYLKRPMRTVSPVYEDLEKSPSNRVNAAPPSRPPPVPRNIRKGRGRGLPKPKPKSGKRTGALMEPGALLVLARPTPGSKRKNDEVIDL